MKRQYLDDSEYKESLYFNFFAIFYYETILEICISIYMALEHLDYPQDNYQSISKFFAWFFIVTTGLFVCLMSSFICIPNQTLKKLEPRVGVIYENMKYDETISRLVPIFFVLKRIMFAVGAFYIKIELVAAVSFLCFLSLCLHLAAKAYLDQSIFYLELFNEAFALVFFISL